MKFTSFLLYMAMVLTGVWYMGSGCANVGSPTGGPKDTIPPQLSSIYPKNGTLNYKEGVIRMEFNETVVQKNLQSELIITPRTEIPYKTRVNKNTVEIRFEEPLADSTTYTFNFREGVGDITEGNVAKNLYLAFSTGNFLDSLTISGNVKDALTDKPIKAATIALYNTLDTAIVTRDKPFYFTTADDSGSFEMRNLKRGRYLLYAFADKNNNLTLQTASESYGYVSDTINLTASLDSLSIKTFAVNAEKPKINSARPVGNYYEIAMGKPMVQYQLKVPGDSTSLIPSSFIEDQKKIRIYPFAVQDSMQVILTATDSLQQELKQELWVKFQESKRAKAPFSVQILPAANSLQKRTSEIKLQFSKPVQSFQLDSVRIQYDSLNWELIEQAHLQWNSNRDLLTIRKNLSPPKQQQENPAQNNSAAAMARGNTTTAAQQFSLIIPKGRIISIESDTADIQEVSYKLATENTSGLISGTVNTTVDNFLVQLIRSDNMQTVQQVEDIRKYTFRLVEPGDYLIRIVIDSNNNGQWDPGNINTLTPPESVFITDQPITIKANWEIQNPEISL